MIYLSNGCCTHTSIVQYEQQVATPEGHEYDVTVVYCKNCGSKKKSSNIEHIKNETAK